MVIPLCSVIHRYTFHNKYLSPLLLLRSSKLKLEIELQRISTTADATRNITSGNYVLIINSGLAAEKFENSFYDACIFPTLRRIIEKSLGMKCRQQEEAGM